MKIPFVGPSYQARSIDVDNQSCVNCYLEIDQNSNNAPIALYGTPGTELFSTVGDGPVRNAIVAGSYAWVVSNSGVYKVDTAGNGNLIGSISTTVSPVTMASNGSQVLIVDGTYGWLITVATSALAKITDPDFPNGVTSCTYQDGYFIVTGDGSQKFYINESPNDGTAWNGLDFASAEGSPDNTVGVISDHRELWLFGAASAEIWVNTGNSDFPFERTGNAFIEHGCASFQTITKLDNTVFWLGQDEYGSGIVWRANGYTPSRVSTHAIEKAIGAYTISDAFAYAYQQEGHGFYVLTFPTDEKTWVYDVATQMWHERAYRNADGTLNRWWNCHFFFNNKHYVGDWRSGNIYRLDLDVYTDNGDAILRQRRTQTMEEEGRRGFYQRLTVEIETGVGTESGQGLNPKMMLRYSNDGGNTWSNEKESSMGAIGSFATRVQFRSLGAGRRRIWEVSMTDPVKFALLGASTDVTWGQQ